MLSKRFFVSLYRMCVCVCVCMRKCVSLYNSTWHSTPSPPPLSHTHTTQAWSLASTQRTQVIQDYLLIFLAFWNVWPCEISQKAAAQSFNMSARSHFRTCSGTFSGELPSTCRRELQLNVLTWTSECAKVPLLNVLRQRYSYFTTFSGEFSGKLPPTVPRQRYNHLAAL